MINRRTTRTMKNWLVHHISFRYVQEACAAYARGAVLDIGCGEQPYRTLVRQYTDRYTAVEHPLSPAAPAVVDAFADIYTLPFKDSSFSTILCSAVLEHLAEPETALREMYRVLKPGGAIICTVPLIWHIHEAPRDFYRYTRYGIEHVFTHAGFSVTEVKAMSGFCVTFGQLLVYYLFRFHRGPMKVIPVIPVIGICIQFLSYLVNYIDCSEQWTWAYSVVAHRE
jgi:SAM-dependent methyltransferase